MKGVVSDIQRFALNDGPGIRTAVFLKGCPLRCAWCSNPETFRMDPELSHRADRCTSCFRCTHVCTGGALSKGSNELIINRTLCNGCGECAVACSQEALRIYGKEMTPGEVLEIIQKDRAYYERSGGGVTLTGGEVLLQAEFSTEILREAKKGGIHTCIETSGYGSREGVRSILPFTDLILFDYKATGETLHRQLTGRSQKGILRNLQFLDKQGAEIVLRCPIIPGLNDNEDHFRAISDWSMSLQSIRKVEVMPFHNYGNYKYPALGIPSNKYNEQLAGKKEIRSWHIKISEFGCTKLNRE